MLDEPTCQIDACHVFVVSVSSCETANYLELLVEEIVSMAAVSHTVIDNQLLQNLNSLIAVKR